MLPRSAAHQLLKYRKRSSMLMRMSVIRGGSSGRTQPLTCSASLHPGWLQALTKLRPSSELGKRGMADPGLTMSGPHGTLVLQGLMFRRQHVWDLCRVRLDCLLLFSEAAVCASVMVDPGCALPEGTNAPLRLAAVPKIELQCVNLRQHASLHRELDALTGT